MANFFKTFGLGLIYMLLLPLLLVVLALFAIYGVFNFLVEAITGLVRFFRGVDPFPEYPEDVAVRAIKAQQAAVLNQEPLPSAQPAPGLNGPSNVYVQQNYYGKGHDDKAKEAAARPLEGTGFFHDDPALAKPQRSAPTITQRSSDVNAIPEAPTVDTSHRLGTPIDIDETTPTDGKGDK
jgi:hypothetical protein